MAFLSSADRQRIEAAIRQAEASTSGEFVAVIARASDSYQFLPTLYAAAVAFVVPLVLWLSRVETAFLPLYEVQLLVFVILALALHWTPVAAWLVPRRLKEERARRLAREQFYARRLHETEGRTGILLFVSAAEHYVEILADRGIDEKVPPGTWDAVVAQFVAEVKAGRVADGFIGAIGRCRGLLAQHFPRRSDDRNELPDMLIEI